MQSLRASATAAECNLWRGPGNGLLLCEDLLPTDQICWSGLREKTFFDLFDERSANPEHDLHLELFPVLVHAAEPLAVGWGRWGQTGNVGDMGVHNYTVVA